MATPHPFCRSELSRSSVTDSKSCLFQAYFSSVNLQAAYLFFASDSERFMLDTYQESEFNYIIHRR